METLAQMIRAFLTASEPMILPIFLCSSFALTIFFERMTFLRKTQTQEKRLKKNVFADLKENRLREVAETCAASSTPLAHIFKTGILNFGNSREEIKTALRDQADLQIPLLENRVIWLLVLGQTTLLLGLLGTALGLGKALATIQQQASTLVPMTAADFAASLWPALLATIAGLCVALPVFWAYHYLVHRIDERIHFLELSAAEFLDILTALLSERQGNAEGPSSETFEKA